MKILITGGQGQVAFELQRLIDANKHQVYLFNKNQLDITDVGQVTEKIKTIQPDIVINTAAYTKVDQAEEQSELAYAVNQEGAKNLSIACKKINAVLLHLSTDYVFDGSKNKPYLETDAISPINVYGKSKQLGEQAIREHCDRHIIIRVSSVFGVHGQNFVKTILRLAKEKENLNVISDQISCPTPAKSIAEMLWQLCEQIDKQQWGTYHFCGTPAVSWHEFATHIIQQIPTSQLQTKHIAAISHTEYAARAKRPIYSVLDCSRFAALMGIEQPNWQKELTHVINELSGN